MSTESNLMCKNNVFLGRTCVIEIEEQVKVKNVFTLH